MLAALACLHDVNMVVEQANLVPRLFNACCHGSKLVVGQDWLLICS